MSSRSANRHLPPGTTPDEVDLLAGGNLPAAWLAAWEREPGRPVLLTPDGRQVTGGQLAERTARAAGRFVAAGLVPRDRILLSCTPSVDLVVAYVGALRAGLTVVPANPAYTRVELDRLIRAARPTLTVTDPTLRELPPPVSGSALEARLDTADADDPALIVFTSGTTGRPKGAMLAHANLLASAHAVRLAWRWTAEDRLVLALPLFHVHGLGVGLHGTLLTGGSAVLLPGFDPAGVADAICEQHGTMFFGVPTMYHRLAASPRLSALRSLRLAVSGSAPLPDGLHRAVGEGGGQQILERYGMSETMMLVSNPYDGERRPGTVGFPLPGVEVRLTEPLGEIEVRGPNVCRGYLDGVGTEAFTEDGWFRTGDIGTLDPDGYLRISGRVKELIITGGYNVYPREVEEVIAAHPGVQDVAVVGVPSQEWGETVAAFVVGDLAGLDEWCAERLAPYKRPRSWHEVDRIPRNPLGKIERHRLVPGSPDRGGGA